MIYRCCDEKRKAAVLGNPTLNGIDYLEVLGFDAVPLGLQPQTTLLLHCLKASPTNVTPNNIIIAGGESITHITAAWVTPASAPPSTLTATQQNYFKSLPDAANVLLVGTSVAGDFSPYTMRLVNSSSQAEEDPFEVTEVLSGIDPQLAEVEFSFKVECPPNFDCAPPAPYCPTDLPSPPPINYLAKDYGSFRTVLLDRLNQLLPTWRASSEADLGIALAESIAYVGDALSYKQDAVSTEAYLQTARSRVSLRRHALLVDYHVHDGCNARVWIHLHVNTQVFLDRTKTRFFTSAPGMPSDLKVGSGNERAALFAGVIVFEPMQDAQLFPQHNQMSFYTWGEADCCLPKGATEATLLGTFTNLQIGDVLIFQEMMGPQTGNPADADIRHRCAVRLTQVTTQNAKGQTLVDPLFEDGTGAPITSAAQNPTPVTEIQWSAEDALPFPFCVSSKFLDSKEEEQTLTDVSVVFGNVVLADHGLSLSGINLETVPRPRIFYPRNPSADRCQPTPAVPVPVRYRPVIPDSPITQAVSLKLAGSPVTSTIVHLLTNSIVTLTDAKGLICLTVQAVDPSTWPNFFGITAVQNAVHPANFDLSVVYNPPGGASGLTAPPVLETLTDLSLNSADPNFVVARVNAHSKFMTVPTPPPGAIPAGFPATPTMLSSAGTTDLKDSGGNTYLTVQPSNPLAWAPSFGVLAQGEIADPSLFNLLVVYAPLSGGVGVPVPVVSEQFNNVSLVNISTSTSHSRLVKVKSFEQEPNLSLSAYALMHYDANQATPAITLTSVLHATTTWTPEQDLLADSPTDAHFVVEVESDGTPRLRFGDNVNGLRPEPDSVFTASYRVGNGPAGNVGAETLIHFAGDPRIDSCTNPMPASGGSDPETADQIRRRAPQAFLTQERAVTMADYERVTEMNRQVDNAVATLRWTGSWYTVFITAEPVCAGNLTPTLRRQLSKNINRYRLAGQDIELEPPQYVSLRIELTVCVDPDYFQADVERSLLQVLGSRLLPNGQKGVFYPDSFTFGQTVYLSPIYAAARKVAGVRSVVATIFEPQGVPTTIYLGKGEIPLGPFQIARLDNDPSLPDHGQLTLVIQGGK
ncbi:MAG TPA: putative baseplate assembly protein [Candidatus Acidoferrum sp.]|nr:putative baseplate assembly protein [Candidatus Acidoferrum sp.]